MEIELPEFIKSDLWRNHLIGLYRKYWAETQHILGFQLYSSIFLRNNMDDSKISHIFGGDYKKTEEEIAKIGKEIDAQEKNGKSDYVKFHTTLGLLQKLQEVLQELNIRIIRHPNDQLEFLDTETKVSLKTNNANE